MLDHARAAGEQPLFHTVGDRALEMVLDAMEATAGEAIWRAVRVRLEHGDQLQPDLMERARGLGAMVVQNPLHFLNAEINADRWGPDRLDQGMPLASLLRAGIPIALGSDVNGVLNPYENIMYAVTHPTNPAEALTVEQAVVAYTSGAAFAEFQEHEKGRLVSGMLADLTVPSQDIFTVPVEQLAQTQSVLTLVGGRIVHCDAQRTPFCS
jgi:predicted amidohydrolase YtcJ